jgi:hypothetical protein
VSYQPRFEEIFESVVLDNILAIVARDFKAGLDYFYPVVAAGVPLLDAAVARPIGTTVLHMDGFTTRPAAGDSFTIAGDPQLYEVVGATALVGTDSDVTFRPGLKVAIAAVDGNEVVTFSGLPDIAQRTLGNFIRLSLPALAIEPDRGGGDEAADGSHEAEQLKVTLYLAVEDADATETVRKLVKYSRALRAVLKTAATADFIANVPPNKVFGLTRELSWQYGQLSKDATRGMWMKPATFELVLKYSER